MPTTKVLGLNVIAIYVTNLEESINFYKEQLGFEKVEDMDLGVLLKSGDLPIYIEECREVRKGLENRRSEFAPCLATDSVKQSYNALKNAGVTITKEYQEFAPTFGFFQIVDPDGNLIEFAGKP